MNYNKKVIIFDKLSDKLGGSFQLRVFERSNRDLKNMGRDCDCLVLSIFYDILSTPPTSS